MKVYEIKDGSEVRGQVMMGIDAKPEQMTKIVEYMNQEFDYAYCQYEEEAEKKGEVMQCWVVSRSDVSYFRSEFKKIKQQIK